MQDIVTNSEPAKHKAPNQCSPVSLSQQPVTGKSPIYQSQSANSFPLRVFGQVSMPFHNQIQESELSNQQQMQYMRNHEEQQRNKQPPPSTVSFFDSDSYMRSPFAMPDDFIQFLFDETQVNGYHKNASPGIGNFTEYV